MLSKNKWSNAFLDEMKNTADEEADALVAKIIETHSIEKCNEILSSLQNNSSELPKDLPQEFLDFYAKYSKLPQRISENHIEDAQQFFTANGPAFGIALMFSSLPMLYAGGKGGAQILTYTGQLTQHFRRRAAYTLEFILDAMEKGGLEPTGKGIITALRVRMMHASIRYFAKHSGKWPTNKDWGEPIHQVELVGTLLAFSLIALEGIKKLGVFYSEADADKYFQTWMSIGHVMGIKPELIPDNIDDGKQLWKQIVKRNFIKTKAGMELVDDHIAFLEEMVPGKALDGIVMPLMRFLIGPKISRNLGLPRPGLWIILINMMRAVFGLVSIFKESSEMIQDIASSAYTELMENLQKYWESGTHGKPFQIPEGVDGTVKKNVIKNANKEVA